MAGSMALTTNLGVRSSNLFGRANTWHSSRPIILPRAVQQYLGHENIQHTVRCTEQSPEQVKSFWED